METVSAVATAKPDVQAMAGTTRDGRTRPSSIIAEAKERGLDLPVEDIIERMFDLADEGERDPEKLRAAVLGKLISASRAA